MAIIAIGARHDGNSVQAVIVITDDEGGKLEHLNPHKFHAANLGHKWVDIAPDIYNGFANHNDLVEHINEVIK